MYPGTTTPYYRYDPLSTGYYGFYPYYNKLQFDGQMYPKFDNISIVNVKYSDIYANVGSIYIETTI